MMKKKKEITEWNIIISPCFKKNGTFIVSFEVAEMQMAWHLYYRWNSSNKFRVV